MFCDFEQLTIALCPKRKTLSMEAQSPWTAIFKAGIEKEGMR